MQKLCIWETEYKIPKIDCIKLRCKNSASGKLNTKYLKSAASSYSQLLGHFCVFLSPQCWCTWFGDWIAINSIGREKESTRREKKQCLLWVSNLFLSGTVGLSLEWLWEVKNKKKKKRKKEKKRETRFLKFSIHKKTTKISNCRVNTTSRGEIEQLGISFSSIFLLFSYESIRGKSLVSTS